MKSAECIAVLLDGLVAATARRVRWLSSWLLLALIAGTAGPAIAQQGICAEVKIEIEQRLSLERQGFIATMRIGNGAETLALTGVGINVTFKDRDGLPVLASSDPNNTSAKFFIRIDSEDGITGGVTGGGTVAPRTTAVIRWLIIPSAGAGGTAASGEVYGVGAELSYLLGTEARALSVTPETITVRPQPRLQLDYFLPIDVYADDALTPQIEPVEAFTLGVRIRNAGGASGSTKIESAQPRIVENLQGLLIAFSIDQGYVQDEPAVRTLLLDFGNIPAGGSKVGRWLMSTTLAGRFIEFDASYTHADNLGGALTSLLESVNTHTLLRDVRVDEPGRDSVRDFLARSADTLRVFESSGIDTLVIDQSASATLHAPGAGNWTVNMPTTVGAAYAQFVDPSSGQSSLSGVTRSDGKVLPLENVWFSKSGQGSEIRYFLNIFDTNAGGTYTLQRGTGTPIAGVNGVVYDDLNANGTRDAGEPGLEGVAMTLSGIAAGFPVDATSPTAADGSFGFGSLAAGTYSIAVGAVAGREHGVHSAGNYGGTVGLDSISNIVLTTGAQATGYAFAKRVPPPPPSADLAVQLTALPANVTVGEQLDVDIQVRNLGPSTSTAGVSFQIPAALSALSATASVGSVDLPQRQWLVGPLLPGAEAHLLLRLRADSTGSASVSAQIAGSVADPQSGNDNASAIVSIATSTVVNAVDDAISLSGGSSAQTFNLAANDEFPTGSSFTRIGGNCANANVAATSGIASFDVGLSACTVNYQVCAPAPEATLCDSATLSVTALLSDMSAAFGAIPSVLSPGQALPGLTLSCTNTGANEAVNASCVPTVDSGVVSAPVCLPAQPVASLANGASIVCSFDYVAPGTAGGGDTSETAVVFTGSSNASNDGTTGNNLAVGNATLLDAVDDAVSRPESATGESFILSTNDQFPVDSIFSLMPEGTCANAAVSAAGSASFDVSPSPMCSVKYRVCAAPPNASVCDLATLEVTALAADMAATFGAFPAVLSPAQVLSGLSLTCANGGANAATDVECGVTTDVGEISALVCEPAVPVASLDAGASIVCTFDFTAPGTAGGTDTSATAVVFTATTDAGNDSTSANNVDSESATIIDALDDDFSSVPIGSVTGGETASVFSNDAIGTVALIEGVSTPSIVDAGGLTGVALNANGTLAVPADTAGGSYAVAYRICTLTPPIPAVCDTAVATVFVVSPALTLVANAGPPSGTSAGSSIGFTFVVTNSGNVELSEIAISEPQLDAPAVCALTTLSPAGTTTCTGTHTLTQAEVDAGVVLSESIATGMPALGAAVSSPAAQTSTAIAANALLNLVKVRTDSIAPLMVGSVLEYSITATNAGNVTLTNAVISDALISALVCVPTQPALLAPGATLVCTGAHTITTADVTAGQVVNTATANAAPPSGPPVTGTDSVTTLIPRADLAVLKTVNIATPNVGEEAIFTLVVTNNGPDTATGVTVTDVLPAGYTLVTASATQGAFVAPNWTVGSLALNASASLSLTVSVNASGPYLNSASVAGELPDLVVANNSSSVSTTPRTPPMVSVAKTVADASGDALASPGEALTYTITLSNSGGQDAVNYQLTDPLDANTVFVSASDGGIHAAGVVSWSGITVPGNGSLVLTLVANVRSPLPQGVVVISNHAIPTGAATPNCQAVPRPVNCALLATAPMLSVSKQLTGESLGNNAIAEPGETLTYTITVANHGGSASSTAVVNETVPAHATFVAAGPSVWSCADGASAGSACDAAVEVPAFSDGVAGTVTLSFAVRVADPLPAAALAISNAVALNGQTPPDCASTPAAAGCVVTPTRNVQLTKSVHSVSASGPDAFEVSYLITVSNLGGSAATYTLTDTLGFPAVGVSFGGNARVSTVGGTLNPALSGGFFVPINGTSVQLSGSAVALASAAIHRYSVIVPITLAAGGVANAMCSGASGNGLFNSAAIGSPDPSVASACADFDLHLAKTVQLGVDNNANGFGDIGDQLHYEFVISNLGSTPLTSLRLLDPRVSDLACSPTTAVGRRLRVLFADDVFFNPFEAESMIALMPGDSIICAATYSLTAADIASRRVDNTATATGVGVQLRTATSSATFDRFQ
jgi:uncharacterized repeat protein (TIGR01451 family)